MNPIRSVVAGLGVGAITGFIVFGIILHVCSGRECSAALLLLPFAALLVGLGGIVLMVFLFRYMRART